MVKNEIKDYGKSNRTKLLNLSRQTKGADYNLILLRFVQDGMRQTMWKAYLKKIKYKDELPFTEVMDVVRERLQPMMLGEVEDEA